MEYLRKWLHFVNERFSPLPYAAMILVFLGAHYVLCLNFLGDGTVPTSSDILGLAPLALATFLFFFKLRLFDEVKDIESDAIHRPERPLPSGVLAKKDVLWAAYTLIASEIILFSLYGAWAFASAMIAIGYSLVMYREFFVKEWLRARLTTYAVAHTFVIVLVSLTTFVALLGRPFTEIPGELIYFSFASWFLFNIFEFGRKTFAKNEERAGVDSYSKILGKLGAVLLVLAMAALSIVFIGKAASPYASGLLFLFLIATGVVGSLYAAFDSLRFARIYRAMTALYIIVSYGAVMLLGSFRIF